MDKFPEIHKLLKLSQEEINNLNIPVISKEIKLAMKKIPTKEISGPDGFTTAAGAAKSCHLCPTQCDPIGSSCLMSAHQAPPSLGFFRQEHWSGLPFPSPMHESEKCNLVLCTRTSKLKFIDFI